MKKLLFVFLMLFIIFENKEKVHASTCDINMIFSDYSLDEQEEFEILINCSNVEIIQSVQLIINLNSYFEIVNTIPCNIGINSYFNDDEIYVNEYLDNIIRFVCFKKTNKNSFNNICILKLRTTVKLSNIYEYFENIKISLFDESYNLIDATLKISEGIKVEWLNDSYSFKLNDELPDFLSDIKILNRNDDEYIIRLLNEDLNTSVVKNDVVSVYIYDYTNNQTIYLSKSISILDVTKPTITASSTINILDSELNIEMLEQFVISDNYDEKPKVYIKYYDLNNKEIPTKENFYQYLTNNDIGYILVYAEDFSKNKSDVFTQTIKVSDTTPPIIKYNDIEINDTDLYSFDIYNYINISDQYDHNPSFFYYINDTNEVDIIKELERNYQLVLTLYGLDKFNNRTIDYYISIKLIDTINPVIEKIQDLEIIDSSFTTLEYELENAFNSSDNFSLQLSTNYTYKVDEVVSKEDFLKALYSNKTGNVLVSVFDTFGNQSNTIEIKIKIIDTTKPVIIVENIEEGKKYLSIPNILYTVTDNFNNELKTIVYLDGEEYKNNTINVIGKHTLEIECIDECNNTSKTIINFEIIKNNLIGCGSDTTCYKDNYIDIIYIALMLLSVSIFIVIVRIALKRNRRRNKEV